MKIPSSNTRDQTIEKIRNAIYEKHIIFIALPECNHVKWIMQLCQIMSSKYKKTGFLSFVWSPEVILKQFNKFNVDAIQSIDKNNFYFIDGTHHEIKTKSTWRKSVELLKTVNQPGNLLRDGFKKKVDITEVDVNTDVVGLADSIYNSFHERKVNACLVDSLAMLPYYFEDNVMVLKFAHQLINKLIKNDITGVFPFPTEKNSIELAKDLQMFADAAIAVK